MINSEPAVFSWADQSIFRKTYQKAPYFKPQVLLLHIYNLFFNNLKAVIVRWNPYTFFGRHFGIEHRKNMLSASFALPIYDIYNEVSDDRGKFINSNLLQIINSNSPYLGVGIETPKARLITRSRFKVKVVEL